MRLLCSCPDVKSSAKCGTAGRRPKIALASALSLPLYTQLLLVYVAPSEPGPAAQGAQSLALSSPLQPPAGAQQQGAMADSSETDKNIEMWKIKRVCAAGFWVPLGGEGDLARAVRPHAIAAGTPRGVAWDAHAPCVSPLRDAASHEEATCCTALPCTASCQLNASLRPLPAPCCWAATHQTHAKRARCAHAQLIKGLESARGAGTSMISLIMPPKDQVRTRPLVLRVSGG